MVFHVFFSSNIGFPLNVPLNQPDIVCHVWMVGGCNILSILSLELELDDRTQAVDLTPEKACIDIITYNI